MMPAPALEKIQIAAQFSIDVDGFREPCTYGPVEMTAREWATFDLQTAIEAELAQTTVTTDAPALSPGSRQRRAKRARTPPA